MKVLFIAGKYRSNLGEWHLRENIRNAEKAALLIWQNGGVAICPHKNSGFFCGAPGTVDEIWQKGDIELISRCDAVFAIEGWKDSSGATSEVLFAKENNIPVLIDEHQVMDFLG